MLPTFVIGLREGIEASLIVGIIAAFLIQRDERRAIRPMWLGVGLALLLCFGLALALDAVGRSLPFRQREALEGTLALVAVAGVTYMIAWMRRHARGMKHALEAHAQSALLHGSASALVAMAFLAVLREGMETAIFMLTAFQSSADPAATGSGAILGVLVAIALGYALYRGGVRIDLARFFRITGFVLVLVAAGLISTAAHDLAEAGVVTILQERAADLSAIVGPGTIHGSLLTGILGFQPVPTVAEAMVWIAYALPMALFMLWPQRPRRPSPTVSQAGVA